MATGSGMMRRIADVMDNIYANGIATAGSGLIGYDPSAITLVDDAAANASLVPGKVYGVAGKDKRFRYGQHRDAVAYAAGQPVFEDAALAGVVTNDVSEAASASLPLVMGICLGVQTTMYFGWDQTHGSGSILHNNDDNAAIGSQAYATVADTGVCDVATSGLEALFVGVGEVAVVAATNLQQAYIMLMTG